MNETLIFPDRTILDWAKGLLTVHFPDITIVDTALMSGAFALAIQVAADEETFFRWAVESSMINYCYNLSLTLLDPPEWMKLVLSQRKPLLS